MPSPSLKLLPITVTILSTAALLSACGETKQDRMLSGAGIGATAGTAGTVLTGGNPWTGALIGGVVGTVAGGLTDPKDFNLGAPFWRD